MNFLKRKKRKDPEDIDLKDEDIIDFDEFEEFEEEVRKNKSVDPREVAKHFIFHVEHGCPVCGGDVKGNEFFKFFCKHCNVLFDKKDIIEQEFGKSISDAVGPVRKTKLTDDESAALAEKRKALSDRIYRTFSEEQKQELIEEAEEERVDEEIESADEEEQPLEEQEPEEVEEVIDEEPEEPEEEADEEPAPAQKPMEHILEAEYEDTDEDEDSDEAAEDTDEDDEEEPETENVEYELEDESHIIASSESDKIHKGNCHFVKKIHPQNRIHFESIEQGEEEGYELCVCLRRLKAMRR